MRAIKKYFMILLSFGLIGGVGIVVVNNYSYIFAKTVEGQVYEIRRVNQPNLVVGNATMVNPGIMHSYAVAIRTLDGKIVTASGEDRKWEVVQKGICVNATFYPYPPWDFEKSGTFARARLNEMKDCTGDYQNMGALPADAPPSNMHEQAPADSSDNKAQPETPVQ